VNAAVGLIRRLLEAGEDHANLVRVRLGTKGKEDEAIADPTMA
jgi:replication-associated recombination protein RarA